MGARLIMVAVDLAADKKIGHAAARLLNRMAISALDDADRPWSQLTMDELIHAMGAEPGEAGKRVVMRARRELVAAKLIKADGGGHRTSAARYDLLFSADSTVLTPVTVGEKGGRNRSERGTKSVGKGDEKRTPRLIEDSEDQEEGTCPNHPTGWHHDEPCRRCAKNRQDAENRPTQSQMQTVQPNSPCVYGPQHRLVADGTCIGCDTRDFFRPDSITALQEARF
jgi:hypothetical protein